MTELAASILAGSTAVIGVGTLYALHHLRIRPQRQTTATLLFWQQAVRPQQTKVLWNTRLSHRKTFALMSAIVLLAAAALIADLLSGGSASATRNVIVIDSGAAMAATSADGKTLLAHASAQASNDLSLLAGSPAVISAGAMPSMLSQGNEPIALVRQALSNLSPRNGASSSRLALQLAASAQGTHDGHILWYTAQHTLPAGLPESVKSRIEIRSIETPATTAIVGVTQSAGALHVFVSAADGNVPLKADFGDGKPVEKTIAVVGGRGEAVFDLAANVKTASFELPAAAGTDAAHHATFTIPTREPLTFRFVGNVPQSLKAALLTCGSESPDGAIAVAERGAAMPTGVHAAIIVEPSDTAANTLVSLSGNLVRPVALEQASVRTVPATPIAGTPLLVAGKATLAAIESSNSVRTLHLSESIVADDADLPRRAAFPVLMSQWCDALAGQAAAPAVVPWLRGSEDPLWQGIDGNARVMTVADQPAAAQTIATAPLTADANAGGIAWSQWLIGSALLLCVVEGLLFARRKIV